MCSKRAIYHTIVEQNKAKKQTNKIDGNYATHHSQVIRGSNRCSNYSCGGCCHGVNGGVVSHTAVGGVGEGTARSRQAVSAEADP